MSSFSAIVSTFSAYVQSSEPLDSQKVSSLYAVGDDSNVCWNRSIGNVGRPFMVQFSDTYYCACISSLGLLTAS